MDLEIVKRSADQLVALMHLVEDRTKAKAFMADLTKQVDQYKQAQLNGIDVKRLKKWEIELSTTAKEVESERTRLRDLMPQAQAKADGIIAEATKIGQIADTKARHAESQKNEAEAKYGNEATVMRKETQLVLDEATEKWNKGDRLEKEALRHRNDAKMALDHANELEAKWRRKLEAFQKAAKA